jgi:hypothetical protein
MNYIYIGQYYHKRGKPLNVTEKKIGITTDINTREYNLNQTKGPIGYAMVVAWKVNESYKEIERAIHALLDNVRSEGEWFEDDDETLIERVANYMSIFGYEKVNLTSSDNDEKELLEQVNEDIEQASKDGIRDLFIMCPPEYGEAYFRKDPEEPACIDCYTKSWVINQSKLENAITRGGRIFIFRKGADAIAQIPIVSGTIKRWSVSPDEPNRKWIYFEKDIQVSQNPPISSWKGSNPVKWVTRTK